MKRLNINGREGFRQMLIAGGLLAGFAVPAALLLGLTHGFTKPKIEANRQASLIASLNEIVPPGAYDNDLIRDSIEVPPADMLGTREASHAYRARLRRQPVAVILEAVAPDGYSGSIRLLVGIRASGELAGIRAVEHRETPGLGDKIDAHKTDWVTQFPGKSLNYPDAEGWRVRKDGGDFDALTGATITPRAVVQATHRALLYFREHRDRLLAAPAGASTPSTTQH